jgi:glutaredoxin-dependent peroxiredoxin
LEQHAPELGSLGASIVAIAVTATFSQQQFAKDLQVSFPLLSDWGGAVSAEWGVRYDVWKGHEGVAKRSLFVVDAEQIVRYAWVTDDATALPDYDEAVAAVRSLTEGTTQ